MKLKNLVTSESFQGNSVLFMHVFGSVDWTCYRLYIVAHKVSKETTYSASNRIAENRSGWNEHVFQESKKKI